MKGIAICNLAGAGLLGLLMLVGAAGCAHSAASATAPTTTDDKAERRALLDRTAHHEGAPVPAARPDDVASQDAILHAVYETISGPPGPRDWNRFRSLFVPGARLIAAVPPPAGADPNDTRAIVLDAEGYITLGGPFLEKEGFFEREVARKTERYADIVQAFSTYESRHAAEDAQPFERGINSFQLLQGGGRWWIVTIYWQGETPEKPIPQEFLR